MNSGFRKAVFFILLTGTIIIGYQYMIKPANKYVAEKKKDRDEKKARLHELQQAKAAAKNSLSSKLAQVEEAIKFFDSRLPPSSEIDRVLHDVTVIAQQRGLKPKTIRTLDIKDNDGYVEQPLKMELEGNFNSFYSFLLELEKLPRITKIRQLQLDKQKGSEGQITADFIVSIFFQGNTG
jgi:type IV pilus assembly protein PilO